MALEFEAYPRQRFADHLNGLKWKQGEHVLLAAPTQCGKTTLAARLATRRKYVVVLASKPSDDNLRARYADYTRTPVWKPPNDIGRNGSARILLWPRKAPTLAEDIERQRPVFKACLDSVSRMRGWCVVVDEAHWASQFLRLSNEIAVLHHQGSSSGISMMTLTQRPAWIPQIVYSSATHAYIGATTHKDDLRQLSNLGGIDGPRVLNAVKTLGRHDLLYINAMGDATPVVINTRQ
jgi:energy-coupling factor transporter ATP-binding protein EcfA2